MLLPFFILNTLWERRMCLYPIVHERSMKMKSWPLRKTPMSHFSYSRQNNWQAWRRRVQPCCLKLYCRRWWWLLRCSFFTIFLLCMKLILIDAKIFRGKISSHCLMMKTFLTCLKWWCNSCWTFFHHQNLHHFQENFLNFHG